MSDNYGVQIERLAAQFEESKRVNEELRASNAALKAENEALKKSCRETVVGLNNAFDGERKDLEAIISRYTSWQPSDPGTKEAMEQLDCDCSAEHDREGPEPGPCPGCVVKSCLRAAMVRLEEAGKERDEAVELLGQCAFFHSEKRLDGSQGALAARSLVLDFLASLHGYFTTRSTYAQLQAAESQVAALTASLASVTASLEWEKSQRRGAEASLSELRKRMGSLEREVQITIEQWDEEIKDGRPGIVFGSRMGQLKDALASPSSPALRTDVYASGKEEPGAFSTRNRPACSPSASDSAPPSPAPVESKPCASPCRKDGCPIHDSPDGCFIVGESKPKPCRNDHKRMEDNGEEFCPDCPAADTAKPKEKPE